MNNHLTRIANLVLPGIAVGLTLAAIQWSLGL